MKKLVYFALGNFCKDKGFAQKLRQIFRDRDVKEVQREIEVGLLGD